MTIYVALIILYEKNTYIVIRENTIALRIYEMSLMNLLYEYRNIMQM